MKKYIYYVIIIILILTGGFFYKYKLEKYKKENKQKTKQEKLNETKENEANKANKKEIVRINGKLFENTGYINSAITCGTMTGEINSTVEKDEIPQKDNESNFGIGYRYQTIDRDKYYTFLIKDKYIVFKNIEFNSNEIPFVVANFEASIEEIEKNIMKLKVIIVPENFIRIFERVNCKVGDIIEIDVNNIKEKDLNFKKEKGAKVKIWFDGILQEKTIKEVYKVENIK